MLRPEVGQAHCYHAWDTSSHLSIIEALPDTEAILQGCQVAQATVERDCSSLDKVSSTQSQSFTRLRHLLGNQLLYSL